MPSCATLSAGAVRFCMGPPDPVRNPQAEGGAFDPPSSIRIGTAGWSYKDWEGIFYPPGMRDRKMHPLEYLARFFDTAEINTSFYGPLKPELAKLWAKKVAAINPRFLFTAKLHRAFTHSPIAVMEPTSAATIRPSDDDEMKTREGLDALANEGKLGALLIQFPVSFKNTSLNREYLERLLRQFIEYPRVVEVRDSSWNNPDTLAEFARHNVAFCNIDQPVMGNLSPPPSMSQARSPTSACTDAITISGSTPTIAMTATTTSTKNANSTSGRSALKILPTRRRPRT